MRAGLLPTISMMAPLPSAPADASARASNDDFESAAEALRPNRSLRHPRLREAAAFLEGNRLDLATKLLQEFLKDHLRDASALRLAGEVAMRQGRNKDAERLLGRCVELAPDFAAARFSYANALLQVNKPEAALAEAEELLKQAPRNPLFRRLKAVALEAIENYAAAAAIWRALTEDFPAHPECWVRYGHSLRILGSTQECIAAYREAIVHDPSSGGAWWALADLKTFRFSETEIERMESQLARADLAAEDRTRLHFALGKAYADVQLYEKSFGNYAKGNALHRLGLKHDPDVLTAYVARCKKVFTTDFFRERAGSECASADPIFIVGMARSGSTLVEQILASHSRIEGTKELSDLAALSMRVQTDIASKEGAGYPEVLKKLDAAALTRLGEEYLTVTRIHRKLGRLFFIDKMGPNFVHVGLVQLILPNAKIVDFF